MEQTITIDIVNEMTMDLLKDLESLQLIRIHQNTLLLKDTSAARFLKGKMTKQSPEEIEQIFKELRGK